MPLILDGVNLARRRRADLAARAAAVRERRGSAPRLLLLAFADPDGRVPHIERKLRACAAVGVDARLVALPADASTEAAIDAMRAHVEQMPVDGVFVQFPFPAGIDADALAAAIPPELDVDVMSPARTRAFLSSATALPPVTVTAGLLLLDGYGVRIEGLRGVVVADESPFSIMFREALARRGAAMQEILSPAAPDLEEKLLSALLVVAAAGRSSLIRSSGLAAGAVAIDAGYFNRGGCGDIDVSGGVEHVAAFAPVPGGIGPMTVSALLERVVSFAEGA